MMQSTQASATAPLQPHAPLQRLKAPAKRRPPRDAAVQTATDSAFLGRLEAQAQTLRGEVASLGKEFRRREADQKHVMADFRQQLEDQIRVAQAKSQAEQAALRRKCEDAQAAHRKGRSRIAFLTQEVAEAHRVAEAAVNSFEKERNAGARREDDIRRAEERYTGVLRDQTATQVELTRAQNLLQKEKVCRKEAVQKLEEQQR